MAPSPTIHPKHDINLTARGIPMHHRKCASILAVLLVASLSVSPAEAQVLYGSAVGTLQDQTGAVIAGAAVTMTNKDTGASRAATSDNDGRYSFANLAAGSYDL
jgi:hypothetical protein